LKKISLVLVAAGESSRFSTKTKKQWIRTEDKPLWLFVADRINSYYNFFETVIVANKNEKSIMKNYNSNYIFIDGGLSRQESLKNGILASSSDIVITSDIARPCISRGVLLSLIDEISNNDIDCVVPYIDVMDTVLYDESIIDRERIKLIQTPQASKKDILLKALTTDKTFTDDSSAIRDIGGKIAFIKGSSKAKKITRVSDLKDIKCLKPPTKDIFTGIGFDVHPFVANKSMVLCGITINNDYGFLAHSDGDVAIHSIIDAIMGAARLGDIGELFPDTDNRYKNIDSTILLRKVIEIINNIGFEIVNIDISIVAQKPKISPFKQDMLDNLKSIMNTNINIKATTTEKLGFVGREEGVAVLSVANLKYSDWSSYK
jgi:2-C-methyl-D-erythritol 4-phosphate cytidylyltransferase/2-C-methyl-D-erythritol 2,4-cyclodiphosphate synthase